MKRKTIAICISGFSGESESKIVSGIARKCQKNNVNLLIFAPLLKRANFPKGIAFEKNLVRGEFEIFNLINYDMLDGMIMFGNSMYKREVIGEIEKKCNEKKIPIVNVNDPTYPLHHNVIVRNCYAMELVVEHLVRVHGLKRINFIGGYPDNKETIERLNAYKLILNKYDIPIEEKRIAYGHFWKEAVECAKKFLEDELPEAIVCANDTMAILVCEYLKGQGYRVPDDIIITGFDGTSDAFSYRPSITTVHPDYEITGLKSYELLDDLINGKDDVSDVYIDSELIVQQSCGCDECDEEKDFNDSRYSAVNEYETFNRNLINTNILTEDSENSLELFTNLITGLWLFAFKRFCFCINSELDNPDEIYFNNENIKYGISKKVTAILPYHDGVGKKIDFESKDLLFYNFLDGEDPVIACFSPLYYRNTYLGYLYYEPSKMLGKGELFFLWAQNAQETIGSFYLQKELEAINLHDPLTGLYNRRGLKKNFDDLTADIKNNQKADKIKEYLTSVCIDIDYLKKINDEFGHEAGDVAIVQTADAIKSCFPEKSICVRTGGDEFCVIMRSDKKPNVDKIVNKIDDYLEAYNKKSELPYKVSCSCGVYSVLVKDFDSKSMSIEDLQRVADDDMYKVKEKHHSK